MVYLISTFKNMSNLLLFRKDFKDSEYKRKLENSFKDITMKFYKI